MAGAVCPPSGLCYVWAGPGQRRSDTAVPCRAEVTRCRRRPRADGGQCTATERRHLRRSDTAVRPSVRPSRTGGRLTWRPRRRGAQPADLNDHSPPLRRRRRRAVTLPKAVDWEAPKVTRQCGRPRGGGHACTTPSHLPGLRRAAPAPLRPAPAAASVAAMSVYSKSLPPKLCGLRAGREWRRGPLGCGAEERSGRRPAGRHVGRCGRVARRGRGGAELWELCTGSHGAT